MGRRPVQSGGGHRAERVAESVKSALGEILRREFQHSSLGFVTITAVTMTRDLRHAKIYVTCLGTEEQLVQSLRHLRHHVRSIRSALAGVVPLKYVPEIRFYPDTTAAEVERIEMLLSEIHGESE